VFVTSQWWTVPSRLERVSLMTAHNPNAWRSDIRRHAHPLRSRVQPGRQARGASLQATQS
jgi:hypothetical protein